jgi:predicted membrane metal-binding protein
MQFGYLPKEPVIDKPTELKFSVQNLETGDQIKNLSARIIVINNAGGQQRSFKFINITAPNGIFSVKYLFPDSGLYNVITKIDSKDFTSLASFNVPVPPPLSSIVNGGILSPMVLIEIVGIIAATVVAAVLLWMNKKKSK